MRLTNDDSSASDVRRVGARCLFAKKARGQGALPVTAALSACAELAGVAHGCASSRASPRPPTATGSAVPAAAQSRSGSGRDTTGTTSRADSGWLPTRAASWRPMAIAATHGSPSKERQTACRISRIQACHPRAGQVSSPDPACLERPQNVRSRREYPCPFTGSVGCCRVSVDPAKAGSGEKALTSSASD